MTREESVKKLHGIIREYFCGEFEYGESCKHCTLEFTLCEPLFLAMYPDFFKDVTEVMAKTAYFKRWGRRDYHILDIERYRQYWIGKRPSTKRCFEAWLQSPDASMNEIAHSHKKNGSYVIQVHVTALVKLGILERRPHYE